VIDRTGDFDLEQMYVGLDGSMHCRSDEAVKFACPVVTANAPHAPAVHCLAHAMRVELPASEHCTFRARLPMSCKICQNKRASALQLHTGGLIKLCSDADERQRLIQPAPP
jgi:hypothetical protein